MGINIKNKKSNIKDETARLKQLKLARKNAEEELEIVSDKKYMLGMKIIRDSGNNPAKYKKMKSSYNKLSSIVDKLKIEFEYYDKLYAATDRYIEAKYNTY